jgi:hypothetical protein
MNDPAPPPPQQYAPVNNPGPAYGSPQYSQPVYAPGYGQPQIGGQGGGFLQSALRTATGVAAGALAFEGIESLMHGFGGHAGYGTGFGGMGGGETINNYYEGGTSHGDLSDRFAAAGDQPSSDIEDRRDTFSGSADDNLADQDPDDFADSSSYDNSSDSGGDFGGSDDGS